MIKNNKKILMSLLALNIAGGSYLKAESLSSYNNTYTRMIKNLDKGKSNQEKYNILESILKKKNKELKDLYLQADYIVKPEYLEWQVFFNSFYTQNNRGGEKKYTENKYIQEVKEIDLGFNIPIKKIVLDDINFNIDKVEMPRNIDISLNIEVPDEVDVEVKDITDFSFTPPIPELPVLFEPELLDKISTGFNQYETVGFNNRDNVVIGNSDLEVNGDKTIIGDKGYQVEVSGDSFNWYGHNDNTTASGTINPGLYTSNVGYFHAFLNALAGSYTVEGNWDFKNETTNVFVNGASHNTVRFVSVNHAYHSLNETTVFEIKPDSTINLYGRSDGHMTVGIEYQTFQGLSAKAINNGTINLETGTNLFAMNAMIERGGSRVTQRESSMENNGKININSNQSIGVDFALYRQENSILTIYIKLGDIEINGEKNYGTRIPKIFDNTNYFNETLIDGSNGTILVNGKQNIGISLSRGITGSNIITAYNGLDVSDSTDVIGNIRNLNIIVNGENTIGILRNSNFSDFYQGNIILKDSNLSTLSFGNNAKDSILIRTDKYGVVLDKDLDLNNSDVNTIENNAVLLANDINNLGNNKTFAENNANINVGESLKKTTALMAANGGYIINNGNINIKSEGSNGFIVLADSFGKNVSSVSLEGNNSLGIYNNGNFIMDSGNIRLSGINSIGVFSAPNNKKTYINNAEINLENEGVNLYVTDGAQINLDNAVLKVSNGGLLTYTYKDGTTKISDGSINITGDSEAVIGDGGTAFYIRGSLDDIPNFINGIFNGNKILNLKMDNSNSRLFILDTPDNPINLTSITDVGVASLIPGDKVNVIGAGYKPYSILRGNLIVDKNADLDDNLDTYKRLEFFSSKVTVAENYEIKGTESKLSGIAQKNYYGTTGRDEIELVNNGSINLSGLKSIGIIGDFGVLKNNGSIKLLENASIGLYASNGSLAENNGIIELGNTGIGIYGSNDLNGTTALYGTREIEINNNNIIKLSGIANNGIGIFANNKENVLSTITLSINSNIDVSAGKSNVGVFAKNSVLEAQGEIRTGEKGVGVYLDNSTANLNNIKISLMGDNSIAYYVDSDSTVNGTGTFEINGKNTVLFNYISVNPSTEFINFNNFNVNTAPDSSYVGANIENIGFYNNNNKFLTKDSKLVLGKNSMVLLNTNSSINSDMDGIIAVSVDGAYNSILPYTFTGLGETVDREVTNRGTISLRNDSIALHVKNNAELLNTGVISLGKNSVGIYADTTKNIENNGTINLGENSMGIHLKESELTASVNKGKIIGTADSSVGIYSEYSGALSVMIKTENEINLIGKNVVGIYTTGTGHHNIENSGDITIGDSDSLSDINIGIYSSNFDNNIVNSGIINIGKNSVGIYSKEGTVIDSGEINVSSSGLGIYSDGGTVKLNNSKINVAENSGVGIFAKNNAEVENNTNDFIVGNKSYGFILNDNSSIKNNGNFTLNSDSILIYASKMKNLENNGIINAVGDNNIAVYTIDGGNINNSGIINMNSGKGNIGIYAEGANIVNTADINVGDSTIIKDLITNITDTSQTRYSIGIYGENSNIHNSGDISIGENAVGIYMKNNPVLAENHGNIINEVSKKTSIGILIDGGKGVINHGDITLYGDKVIGIYGKNSEKIINKGTITVEGEEAIGIYSMGKTEIENQGIINVSGFGSIGISAPSSQILNSGTIHISNGAVEIGTSNKYPLPELINIGIIEVDGRFDNKDLNISIKPDLSTLTKSTIEGVDFVLKSGSIVSEGLDITETVKILPDFSQGTNAKVYKLEDVFLTGTGGVTSPNDKLPVISKSLTWEATPVLNGNGNVDIYMQKIDYKNFTDGQWYEDFGIALDEKYEGSTGKAGSIFDKIDLIEDESDFRDTIASLAGNIYANINQRENDIANTLENSLHILQNSTNNTKENVKISVIGGKGKNKEDTEGVIGYNYTTTGALALREVERTYKQTFAYSIAYLHTGFEFKDGNESEEWVDTVQLGLHNKYKTNGWQLRNDITGRVSIHNIDRNIDWPNPINRSEIDGTYETYSITSDNLLGKEFNLGKNTRVMPYGGLRAMYVTRPGFEEKGLEALNVERNDAWSVKPRAGIELNTSVPLGSSWQLSGTLDFSYEYELADLNEKERVKLVVIEDGYHNLSKPKEEKGIFRTKASVGVEVTERYGIFLTGEYSIGEHKENDYRAGVNLKAVF